MSFFKQIINSDIISVYCVTKSVFSLFLIQDNSDIKIECRSEDRLRNEKTCNVSAPFMRAMAQVSLFDHRHEIMANHVQVS